MRQRPQRFKQEHEGMMMQQGLGGIAEALGRKQAVGFLTVLRPEATPFALPVWVWVCLFLAVWNILLFFFLRLLHVYFTEHPFIVVNMLVWSSLVAGGVLVWISA